MKIVQIIPSLEFGGAEIMCEHLVNELKSLGHDVMVISLYERNTDITQRLKGKGINVKFMQQKSRLDLHMFYKLFCILKKERPDVIHTHLIVARYVFPIAALLNYKVIHTVHTIATKEERKIIRRYYNFFYKNFDVTPVALSEEVKKTIIEEYCINKSKVPVIFNGIDLSQCIEKKNYLKEGDFKILHVGRFFEAKNHLGLLSSFKMFHSKIINSELWLVGDGEEREKIEDYIRNNDLTDCVKLLGAQNNVYRFLHDADIFTLPSIYEGMPMSLIEAMGTGLPIVATAVGGVPDMLSEDSAQLTSVDEKELLKAFEKYYNDSDLREKHGKLVKELSKQFSAEIMAKRYLELYLK